MPILDDGMPSSRRKPAQTTRFAQGLLNRAYQPIMIPAAGAARAAAYSKSRFFRLPQEPEDARLTGVTRSLNRRLLALNLRGSLLREDLVAESKIA